MGKGDHGTVSEGNAYSSKDKSYDLSEFTIYHFLVTWCSYEVFLSHGQIFSRKFFKDLSPLFFVISLLSTSEFQAYHAWLPGGWGERPRSSNLGATGVMRGAQIICRTLYSLKCSSWQHLTKGGLGNLAVCWEEKEICSLNNYKVYANVFIFHSFSLLIELKWC